MEKFDIVFTFKWHRKINVVISAQFPVNKDFFFNHSVIVLMIYVSLAIFFADGFLLEIPSRKI